ncbi:MAG: PAS domain S-box protein [Bacteroidales bacterium]|nr:PAS domain S-box protein [Bacteroidales bacterium]
MRDNIFNFLFENSSDAIFLSDLHGNLIEVNKTACDIMGYTKHELTKMNFRDLKTPKYRQSVGENIKRIIENKLYTYETEHQKKNGEICPIEIKSRLTEYNNKTVIISVARNIAERKEFEKQLLQTIIKTEEKERKRFAADLHDGLSPLLSTIKLYADLLKSDDLKNTNKKQLLQDIEDIAELAISTAKEIANNITPGILHDFGLAIAVNEFCKYVNNTKKIKIEVKTGEYLNEDNKLIDTVLYQSIKELINNAVKHSGAQNVKIELKTKNKQIILYYKDDGKGFDLAAIKENNTGLGLKNIMNKIKTIKGTCDFYSKIGEGVRFMAVIKI